jgi:uncharacterized membrane protein HdeD (DUF308 family)
MSQHIVDGDAVIPASRWLRGYYFTRAVVALGWVALAFTVGRSMPPVAGALLVAYPAWDGLANWADARRNGGLGRNKSQALNLVVSVVTAVAVVVALGSSMNAVLAVFGVWATLAGLFQLVTGVRRWKSYGAQWAMILSGAQSTLVGGVFVKQASGPVVPDITAIAPYAAFGAFYFLLSALWLTVAAYRSGSRQPA